MGEPIDPGLAEATPDWKAPTRAVESKASKKARNREPWCVICCEERSAHSHHIVFRSQGGGDRRGNLCGACTRCHDLIHAEDGWARRTLGEHVLRNRPDTIEYLAEKYGEPGAADWLARRLLVP